MARNTSAINDIEEGAEAYKPGGFHPVYIGDVFHKRYQVLNKIGWGAYSTVWLVRDLEAEPSQPEEFRALKVLSAEVYGGQSHIFEREILKHLRDGNPSQIGYSYICHLLEDFEHHGPNGTHICLVFELMGETLRSFGAWFVESRLPNSVVRRFTIQLLLALDYAHDFKVIHTDLKPDNIFVKFRDYSRISSGYLASVLIPDQDRTQSYRAVPSTPLRRYYFNESDSTRVEEFDIALGDWGVSSWVDKHLSQKIQPVALRSPEVLIEAPWDASTDWWNLGAVLLEIFRAVRMFSGQAPPNGDYDLRVHLSEIVDLFGPFPKVLLEKGDQGIVKSMFDSNGKVKGAPRLHCPSLSSEAFLPGLDE